MTYRMVDLIQKNVMVATLRRLKSIGLSLVMQRAKFRITKWQH